VNRGLIWSVSLHAALFLLFLLGPTPDRFDWDRADAVSVDLVELPALEKPEPEPEPAPPDPAPPEETVQEETVQEEAPEEKTEPPPDPEPVRPPPKPKPKPPQRVFKRYAPPRQEPEPSLAERLRKRLDEAATEAETAEPPETSAAQPATGSTAEVEAVDFPYAWYLNVLRTKITAAWDPPGERMLAGHARQVIVEFRIHRDGRITDVRIGGASGTPGLDASARRAVDAGGPYPPLPPEFEGEWLDVGVRFTVREGGA
jgi:TonB family protein